MYFQLFYQYFIAYFGILRKMEVLTLAIKCIFMLSTYALLYILLINNRLIEFTRGWNNHPFLTERNRSPNQLWGLE